MHSLDMVREFASTLLRAAVRPDGLALTAAMLTCTAILLNVGPFAPPAPVVGASGPAAGAAEPPARFVQAEARPATFEAEPASLSPLLVGGPIASAFQFAGAPDATTRPEPVPPSAAVAEPAPEQAEPKKPTVIGIWAPDAGPCSPRSFHDGVLPTVINAEGAWAGETFCTFSDRQETEAGWKVVARCSSGRTRWTSKVRLTVKDDRLVWTSRRGTQVYSRCTPDTLMAQAR